MHHVEITPVCSIKLWEQLAADSPRNKDQINNDRKDGCDCTLPGKIQNKERWTFDLIVLDAAGWLIDKRSENRCR